MANRIFLVQAASTDPPDDFGEDDIVVGSGYMFPVLWASVFTPDDIRTRILFESEAQLLDQTYGLRYEPTTQCVRVLAEQEANVRFDLHGY